MSESTIEQLDERIEQIKSKLQLQIEELVNIIANDLPDYALKHIRRAFIEDVDFAESKSDAELAAFKNKVAEFGQKLSEDVRANLLENMDDWWGKDVSLTAASKTLDGNPAIAQKLSVISQRILDFLDAEHLQRVEVVYRTPARFIDGKYPPGMIEKYWAKLADLRAAEEERELLDREARKARIAQRWDSL
ncbi:MAG: hypothetical protein II180_02190 [Proteobacteria bacterium]|nr:hypothetical protein [Pseudomonadota bacterium]